MSDSIRHVSANNDEMSKIYHYTKLSTTIQYILPEMQLRASSLNQLNDPKENQAWSFSGANVRLNEIYPSTYSDKNHFEHVYKLGGEIKKSIQVLCFVHSELTKGFDNEMMWAHIF